MKKYGWLYIIFAMPMLHCADNQRQTNALVTAASEGNLENVKTAIAEEASLNGLYNSDLFFDPLKGKTALGAAIEADQTSVIDYLLSQPTIDINRATLFECHIVAPLAIAVEMNKPDLVKKLIQHKANINAQCNQHYTPIYYALISRQDTTPIIHMLLDAGANIFAKDIPDKNFTILEWALGPINFNKQFSHLKALFDKSVSLNGSVNDAGQTLGHLAVQDNYKNLAQFLVDEGIRTDIPDRSGKTILTTRISPKKSSEENLKRAEEIQEILNNYQEKMAIHKAALQHKPLTPEEQQKFGTFPRGITSEIADYLTGPLTPGQKKELNRQLQEERAVKIEKPSKSIDELSTLLAQERNKVTRLKSELRKFLSPKEFDALMMEIEKS